MKQQVIGCVIVLAAVGCSANDRSSGNLTGSQSGEGALATAGTTAQAAGNGGAGSNAGAGGRGTIEADAGNADASDTMQDAAIPDPWLELPVIDCGAQGLVLEGHGPPSNRVNYVIVGDGYTEPQLDTLYVEHLQEMLSIRFSPELEPYARYRKFVNICALKAASQQSGVGTSPGNTAFSGWGNDESRLGYVDDDKVEDAISALLPSDVEVDWTAIVLNGDRWWNAGGRYMVWSGAHPDAALAAQHEGGHSFQKLADEYGGNCDFSGDEDQLRVNVTIDPVNTAGKWKEWLGFHHTPGTGEQGVFEGAQYCDRDVWRPSDASVMNILWDSSYFNAVSREAAIRIIYDVVRPIDAAAPESSDAPDLLWVQVVDADVIKVDWSVDGEVVAANGGQVFDVAARKLPAGTHSISARAYDDTPWVRGDRSALEESRSWTVVVP